MLFSGSYGDRGITYDANGRRIGLSASSSVGGLRDREPVPQGRLELRRRRQPAPAVLRQPLQDEEQGRLSLGRGQSRAAHSRYCRARPAARHRRRFAGRHRVQRVRAVRRSRTRTSICSAAASPPMPTRGPGDALPGRQWRRPPGSADRADRHSWSISRRSRRRRRALRTSWTRGDLFTPRAGAARRPGRREGRDRAEPRAHQSRVGAADEVHEHRAVRAALVRHRPGDRRAAACAAKTASSR